MSIAVPTMLVACRNCRNLQRVPIPVAEGTDPWFCAHCGLEMQISRCDLIVKVTLKTENAKTEETERSSTLSP